MTQVKSAQRAGKKPALRSHASTLTLAQRRASFEAQMRAMALADLEQVAARLRHLHDRLNRKDGREWTILEIAQGADVAPRTFQTWIGAKNENAGGDGYEKLARFYRRKLNDKTITKNWIVFGDEGATSSAAIPSKPVGSEESQLNGSEAELLQRVFEMVTRLSATVDGLVNEVQELKRQLPESDEASGESPPPPPS